MIERGHIITIVIVALLRTLRPSADSPSDSAEEMLATLAKYHLLRSIRNRFLRTVWFWCNIITCHNNLTVLTSAISNFFKPRTVVETRRIRLDLRFVTQWKLL